jgi:hypothetical protein
MMLHGSQRIHFHASQPNKLMCCPAAQHEWTGALPYSISSMRKHRSIILARPSLPSSHPSDGQGKKEETTKMGVSMPAFELQTPHAFHDEKSKPEKQRSIRSIIIRSVPGSSHMSPIRRIPRKIFHPSTFVYRNVKQNQRNFAERE